MNGKLCHIEIIDIITVYKCVRKCAVAAYLAYLLTGIIRRFNDLADDVLSVKSEVPSGNIERGKEQIRCARCLRDVYYGADVTLGDFGVFAYEEKAALRERAARFMH